MTLTIPLTPVTKKNSQRIIVAGGRPRIIPSAKYKQYEKDVGAFMPFVSEPIKTPVNVRAVFYMPTRRRVDLVNLQEALLDVLTLYGVIEDDNAQIVASMDGSRVEHDKANPRTEVYIEDIHNDER